MMFDFDAPLPMIAQPQAEAGVLPASAKASKPACTKQEAMARAPSKESLQRMRQAERRGDIRAAFEEAMDMPICEESNAYVRRLLAHLMQHPQPK